MAGPKTKSKSQALILAPQKEKIGEVYGPSPIFELLELQQELEELLNDKEVYRP